jgi:DNA-binding transcriptional regulator YdaS (Cro superfamily)
MTAMAYKATRELRGSQVAVARLLGVHSVTISKRECGVQPVSREAELALLTLPKKRVTQK